MCVCGGGGGGGGGGARVCVCVRVCVCARARVSIMTAVVSFLVIRTLHTTLNKDKVSFPFTAASI